MKIYVFKDKSLLFDNLANEVIKEVKIKPNATLGLATGGTMQPLYERLIKDHIENKTSYKNIKTFNLDEYIGLPPTHEQSYNFFMYHYLFNHIDIDRLNINFPSGIAHDLLQECSRYNNLLNEQVIDLQLLGIGNNSHIAFNEPGTSFDSETTVISLTNETIVSNGRFFANLAEVPTTAITMGIKSIMNAKRIVLVATGKLKALAIKATIEGEVSQLIPSSILQEHPNVEIYLDVDAASLLKKDENIEYK